MKGVSISRPCHFLIPFGISQNQGKWKKKKKPTLNSPNSTTGRHTYSNCSHRQREVTSLLFRSCVKQGQCRGLCLQLSTVRRRGPRLIGYVTASRQTAVCICVFKPFYWGHSSFPGNTLLFLGDNRFLSRVNRDWPRRTACPRWPFVVSVPWQTGATCVGSQLKGNGPWKTGPQDPANKVVGHLTVVMWPGSLPRNGAFPRSSRFGTWSGPATSWPCSLAT